MHHPNQYGKIYDFNKLDLNIKNETNRYDYVVVRELDDVFPVYEIPNEELIASDLRQ